MPNKMERFTQRARRVLNLAQEEAERLHHNYIGTEHMLLGMIREEGGVAGRVLRDLGVEQPRVEELVIGLTHAAVGDSPITLDLSPGTKRVVELAVDEARRMGHHYIGTEHLLLGLVRQSEGVAIDVLKRLSISPEEVRRQTRRVLQENPVQNSLRETQQGESEAQRPDVPAALSGRRVFSPAALPNPFQFRIVENIVNKILEMLAREKITSAQASELLGSIQPDLKLTPGEQARIGSLVTKPESAGKQHVTVTVKDKASGAVDVQMQMRLEAVLSSIDAFLVNAMNNRPAQFVFESSDGRKQLIIDIAEDAR